MRGLPQMGRGKAIDPTRHQLTARTTFNQRTTPMTDQPTAPIRKPLFSVGNSPLSTYVPEHIENLHALENAERDRMKYRA